MGSSATRSPGVSASALIDVKAGTGPTAQSIVRNFPGIPGTDENFWVWLIFGSALVYMLGVHWTLGEARRIL
jgi:hypothetical protein